MKVIATTFVMVVVFLFAYLTRPGPVMTPRFALGDVVEFKGLGAQALVVDVRCTSLGCRYVLLVPGASVDFYYPEVLLEKTQ